MSEPSNMSPNELQVFRVKDRLVSTLQSKRVWASPAESLAQLIGRVGDIDETDWFIHVINTPEMTNSNRTPTGAWTGVATNIALIPADGWTFDINYPEITYKQKPIIWTPERVKLLSMSFKFFGTSGTAAAVAGTGFTVHLHMCNNSFQETKFVQIPDDTLTTTGVRISNPASPVVAPLSFHTSTYQFKHTKSNTAFTFTVGQHILSANATGYLRLSPIFDPMILIVRKP